MHKVLLILLMALAACMPEKGKESPDCGQYQVFDSKTRTCINTAIPRTTPSGTLSNVTVAEDSGTTLVTLTYSDVNSDLASGCSIAFASSSLDGNGLLPVGCSCVAGLCRASIMPDTNFYGLAELRYKIVDIDGIGVEKIVGVTVTPVDDTPVNDFGAGAQVVLSPANGANVTEDTPRTWTLGYSDVELDKASACNIQNVSTHFNITDLCSCDSAGICTFDLQGTQDFFGNGEFFTYQIYANGKWSTPSTVFFNITAVNDAPVLNASVTYNVKEGDNPNIFSLLIGSGTGTGTVIANYVSGSGSGLASDVDDLQADLEYYIVSGTNPAISTFAGCMATDDDLDCVYTIIDANYNNDYLRDTVRISIDTNSYYLLRLNADEIGDHSADPIKITFTAAGSGSGASLLSIAGNHITMAVEVGVTTAQQIKYILENDTTILNASGDSAQDLVDVYMLGSVPVDATTIGTFTLTGGRAYTEKIVYKVRDNAPDLAVATGSGVISINITPQNDVPSAAANFVNGSTFNEDAIATFNLRPGTDVDYTDSLQYRLKGTGMVTGSGTLSGCLDQSPDNGSGDLTCTFTPAKNYSGPVEFDYYTNDGLADAAAVTRVRLDITAVNDTPIICQYSTYSEAPECGLNDCVGTTAPSGNILPASHTDTRPVYFYETDTATCWKSTGTGANTNWEEDVTGHISDYTVNQNDPIVVDHIRLDEGGGDTDENNQTLYLSIESENPVLFPQALIKVYWVGAGTQINGVLTSVNCKVGATCQLDNSGSEDLVDLKLVITPSASTSGEGTIKVKIEDSDAVARSVYQRFKITVNSVGASHQGWANIKAVGPKITRDDKPIGDPFVCSYSQTKCNSGQACIGTGAPTGYAPDELNALYLDDTTPAAPKCYVADAEVNNTSLLGDLTFRARQEKPITVEIINDDNIVSGSEEVYVSGGLGGARNVLIKIKSGDTISDNIETKIMDIFGDDDDNGDCEVDLEAAGGYGLGDGNCLLTVTNNNPGAVQTASGTGPVSLNVKARYVGKFGNIVYISSTAGASVEYKNDSSLVGVPTVEVLSQKIEVTIKSGITTSNQIYTALLLADTTIPGSITGIANFAFSDPTAAAIGATVSTMAETILIAQSARASWRQMNTYCAISQSDQFSNCRSTNTTGYNLGASCIGFFTPATAELTDEDAYFYDAKANLCYRGRQTGPAIFVWDDYSATGTTTLEWNPFLVSGTGSITGYKIFRRLGDGDGDGDAVNDHSFDFSASINIRNLASDATSFTDDFSNSRMPPIPKTVYFYEVRPIIDGILSTSTEPHRIVRVISPPNNMAFVHRWMVNKNICELMHSQERDLDAPFDPNDYLMRGADEFYRCKYHGPGDTRISATEHYYDIGKDLLVDVGEAGCPYTKGCTKTVGGSITIPSDGSCIGRGDPNGEIDGGGVLGKIFYDRASGICYANWAPFATDWHALDETNTDDLAFIAASKYNKLHNAPIVNINQQAAFNFCNSVPEPDGIVGATLSATKMRLPNRRHQIAFSQWHNSLNDSDIDDYETGTSLNASQKCNSSAASGYVDKYEDAPIPSVSNLFTLPGDQSGAGLIRSIYTGSTETLACSSRYGIQDAVGNVAEFLSDRFRCSGDPAISGTKGFSQCYGISSENTDYANVVYDIGRLYTAEDLYLVDDDSSWGTTYGMGTTTSGVQVGPCNDTGTDGICDGSLKSWIIEDMTYESGRFFVPLGLPAHTLFPSTNTTSEVGASMMAVTSTNGITSSLLHNDTMTVNSDYIFSSIKDSGTGATKRGCGAMIAGGGWNDNAGAGVWNFELIPCDDAYGYLVLQDIVFRKLSSSSAYEIDWDLNVGAPGAQSVPPNIADAGPGPIYFYDNIDSGLHSTANDGTNQGLKIEANIADYTGTTAAQILNLLRLDTEGCMSNGTTLCDAYMTGNGTGEMSYTKSGTDSYTDVSGETSGSRPDVGFRCMVEIKSDNVGGDYNEAQFE